MHYYSKNIGDYAKKTGRLTMLEHGAYNLIMDAYYDRERPPTKEEAIQWSWARAPEEIAAVEFVLSRFFTLEDGVYRQSRIDEELQYYHGMCLTNSENGKRGGRPRKKPKTNQPETDSVILETDSVASGLQSGLKKNPNESLNQEPRTNNQEPLKDSAIAQPSRKTRKESLKEQNGNLLITHGVPESIARDFSENRKTLITNTVIKGIKREADLAGIDFSSAIQIATERSWQSFKAEWVKDKTGFGHFSFNPSEVRKYVK